MEDKVYLLMEDDTEIFGNGTGHVMHRVYLPVVRYCEILKEYKAKSTFYIDMAHWLFLNENAGFKDFRFQAELIETTIVHLLKNDMEVQLHLHSQWANARIENGQVYVTDKWNIGQLDKEDQEKIFLNGAKRLREVIVNAGYQNEFNSFKAGSWGLQPFHFLYDTFVDQGVKIVLGPTKDLVLPALDLDYSGMESEISPYYCRKEDINSIGDKMDITIVPMTPTYLNWIDLARYVIHVKYRNFMERNDKDLDIYGIPNEVLKLNPVFNRDSIHSLRMPYKTNLKMNKQPYWYLKKTFRRAYDLVMKNDYDYKLMVLETHTKDFKNVFQDIDKFMKHLTSNYENIEFITTSDLVEHIKQGKLNPLFKS
ncbi:polysaccharide deacetylase family protein [Maribacter flavus]|uniref:Polysaccharide deacetylase n=1 Tax=Maribacter flavus TaxID=1658664 RepID=A0A5B2TQQ3_9FLAO|nr:hypothetical protein [Maribacter flavus]KAA2216539.1 hypothetical protein F0361_11075 [Maribacter flavus]